MYFADLVVYIFAKTGEDFCVYGGHNFTRLCSEDNLSVASFKSTLQSLAVILVLSLKDVTNIHVFS